MGDDDGGVFAGAYGARKEERRMSGTRVVAELKEGGRKEGQKENAPEERLVRSQAASTCSRGSAWSRKVMICRGKEGKGIGEGGTKGVREGEREGEKACTLGTRPARMTAPHS